MSSNRRDTMGAFGSPMSDFIELSNEQIGEIEKAGSCKVTDELKCELEKALNWYLCWKSIDEHGSLFRDQQQNVVNVLDAVSVLYKFLTNNKDHSMFKPRILAQNELALLQKTETSEADWHIRESYIGAGNDDGSERNIWLPELERLIGESKELGIDTIIDFEKMEQSLLLLSSALKRVQSDINVPIENGRTGGGEEDSSLNLLLFRLASIYDKTTHQRGGQERFIEQCCNYISDEYTFLNSPSDLFGMMLVKLAKIYIM